MKTLFNHDLLIKLIKNSSSIIPGVERIEVNLNESKFDENEIFLDVWFENQIINLKSVIYDLQKTIFFNLSKQLDEHKIKINVIVHS